jgi:hypothetical protein
MNIDQVKAAALAMAAQMTVLVQAFEQQTGCVVHSLPVRPADKKTPATVEVKVQIG